jgi:uncharacterized protein YxeA
MATEIVWLEIIIIIIIIMMIIIIIIAATIIISRIACEREKDSLYKDMPPTLQLQKHNKTRQTLLQSTKKVDVRIGL